MKFVHPSERRDPPRAVGFSGRFRSLLSSAALLAAVPLVSGMLAGCVVEEEPLPEVPSAKRVFASSAQVNGNLGGLTGADALCGTWAQAADLGGSWKAFLSATGTNAISRLNEVGPWYNVTRQTKVFNNKTGFTVGALSDIRTEYNASASGDAWTGTKADGTVNGTNHCTNWTSGTSLVYASVGTPGATVADGALWMTKGGNIPACNATKRVYCFEQ